MTASPRDLKATWLFPNSLVSLCDSQGSLFFESLPEENSLLPFGDTPGIEDNGDAYGRSQSGKPKGMAPGFNFNEERHYKGLVPCTYRAAVSVTLSHCPFHPPAPHEQKKTAAL